MRKTEDDGVYPSPLNVKAVRLDRIVADDNRPARTFSEQSLDELGRSLLIHGQMAPIMVQYLSDDDTFILVDGERRWRAAQKVGLQTLQAVILSRLTPEERYDRQMAVSLHQQGWDGEERMDALQCYKTRRGLDTWAGVAESLGLSESGLSAAVGSSSAPVGCQETPTAADAAAQTAAATRLLDDVFSRLRPGRDDDGQLVQALDDLARLIASQRARLERARRGPAAKGKPVQHMPTWG